MLQHRLKAIKYNVSLREPSWNKRKLTAFKKRMMATWRKGKERV